MKQTFRIGTRGSQLALWQADFVQQALERTYPDHRFERIIIKTEGDQDQQSSLKMIGGQGVFTKAIEMALLRKEIDIAVHSLKDLPSEMNEGLVLGAVPERGPVEDVLVSRNGITFSGLPPNAKIATGSIRRQSQILEKRPDIRIFDLRGNIHTRISKLYDQDLDAIIMARAALVRLEIEN
ncbi:MAG: hydroxymethylbilane synthase, partial [Cyclobacteriaceae bacterium]|nr:hydroxymethylbilane synthase [Cyclobacteriaceae bacterium]